MFLMLALVVTIPFSSIIDWEEYDNASFTPIVSKLVSEGLDFEYMRAVDEQTRKGILECSMLLDIHKVIEEAEVEGEAQKRNRLVVLWMDNDEYKVSFTRQNLLYSIRIKKLLENYRGNNGETGV